MTKAYEKAINNYAVTLLLDPTYIEYVLHITECQIAALYPTGAVDMLNRLLALDSSPENPEKLKPRLTLCWNYLKRMKQGIKYHSRLSAGVLENLSH